MTTSSIDRPSRIRTTLPNGLPVLETKLAPPRRRPGIVSRPRLLGRFEHGRNLPILVASAPAGFGKSLALGEWAGGEGRALAWLTLDERDADVSVLVGYITVALDRAIGMPAAMFGTLETPGSSVWTSAVPAVGAAIAASTQPFALILDDGELATQEGLDVIVTLAGHLPAGSQIVLATRTTRLMPVPRLLASGAIALVERDELALDDDEAAAMLAAAGAHLEPADVHRINEGAEGWPAGVYLTALAATDRSRSDERPVAEHRLVADYVRTEILAGLPDEELRFLVHTAVLEHLNPSLCDAVLEVEGSGEVLERLERSNLFLVPLDARGTSYRWHGMLRDILLRELLRSEPHAVPTLNARAAAWHEEAGDSEAALEYALAAGDDERVGRLLPAMAQRALNSGRIGTVRRWYDWFDRHGDPSRHTEATSLGGVLFAMAGDAGAAERWADQAARAAPAGVEDAGVRSFMLALLCRRGVDGMHVDAEAAVAALPVGHRLGTASRGLLGIAEALHGNVELGERLLEEAADGARGAPSRNTAHAIALTMASWLATRRGDRELAEARVREARRVALDGQLAEQAAGVAVAAASARLSAARGALGLVRTDVAHAQRHRGVLTYAIPWLAVRARLDLATALLAMSEPASARMLLGEIRDVLVRRPGLGLLEEEVEVLRGRLDAIRDGVVDASALTMAELRLLPLLATHLSFAEIGDRLTVSTNTVKTHAKSIYRKVDAGSRSEAIERAVAIGLLVSPTASVWLVPSD